MAKSDADLVAGLLADRQLGMRDVYDQYSSRLYGYALTITHDQQMSEDTVQDALLRAMDGIEKLRDANRFRAWLFAITRNECLRQLRARNKVAFADQSEKELENLSEEVDLDRDINRNEAAQLVQAALAALSPADRDIISMALQNDLDAQATAQALGVQPSHVHARLSRARNAMAASVSTVMLAATHGKYCSELKATLAGHSRVNPLIRKRVANHVKNCRDCTKRSKKALANLAYAFGLPLTAVVPLHLRPRVMAAVEEVPSTGPPLPPEEFAAPGGFPTPVVVGAGAGSTATAGPPGAVITALSLGTQRSGVAAGTAAVIGLGLAGLAVLLYFAADPAAITNPPTATPEPGQTATREPSAPAPTPSASESRRPEPTPTRAESPPVALPNPATFVPGGSSGPSGGQPTRPANQVPTARFTTTTNGLGVRTDASGSSDPDGSNLSYSWDFTGNGTPDATGRDARHTYSSAGKKRITLTITDAAGASASTSQIVRVSAPPIASFSRSVSGLTATVDASASSDPEGGRLRYKWDYTNNGSWDSSGKITQHTYANPGTYQIRLRVTDKQGNRSYAKRAVTVTDVPTASFTYFETAGFVSTDASGSSDPGGGPLTYEWDWDSTCPPSTGVTSSCFYTLSGTYTVTLTVTNNLGKSAMTSQNIPIP